jgi:uncharacterized membrane protein YphA (DoxX/SURF4 family)
MTGSVRFWTAALLLFRLVLGGIFVYAGVAKIIDPAGFAQSIHNYQILPELLVQPAAIILPWVEVVGGAALLLRWWTGGASLLLSALMLVFFIALSITIARGLDISCGCFSSTGAGKVSWLYLIRDFTLFAMGAILFLNHEREGRLP